ncbi:MAG: methyl-accepting chemotaxis protein [Mariprofundaceae bacterium]|nr:methyl-accepting chemotaxis protein [Mariprofundaceae bacterium]
MVFKRANQSFQEVNQRSQDAIQISKQAMLDASNTSQRMQTLQTASDNIGSVIATITEIADKTNLLALNASIEAARAGDVGRGFAVVASEVKSLANQTSQATQVIAQQIDEVQSECQAAITAIHGIRSIIEHMNEHTLHIAEVMQQYSQTLADLDSNADAAKQGMQSVRLAVNTVHQSAEQSDAISTEVAQHCAQLQNIALEQEQLVEQFLTMLQHIRNNGGNDQEQQDDALF